MIKPNLEGDITPDEISERIIMLMHPIARDYDSDRKIELDQLGYIVIYVGCDKYRATSKQGAAEIYNGHGVVKCKQNKMKNIQCGVDG